MNEKAVTQVGVELEINRGIRVTTEEFHRRALELMDQLMEQEAGDPLVTDTSVSSDAAEFTVTVDLLIHSDDPIFAVTHASSSIRTALHALGAATPGWPNADDIAQAIEGSSFQTERTLVPC